MNTLRITKYWRHGWFLGLVLALVLSAFAGVASAATISSSMSIGSTGSDVTSLQTFLASDSSIYPEGLVTGYYGPLTAAAVRRFQARYGIDQVGVVGPITRSRINSLMQSGGLGTGGTSGDVSAPTIYNVAVSASGSMTTGYPVGCTSSSGYSTVTGQPCSFSTGTGSYPLGCTSILGYSTVTGLPCSGSMNATTTSGTATTTTGYPVGCTSSSGYSTTTGQLCSGLSYPAGCTSTSGYSTITGQPCSVYPSGSYASSVTVSWNTNESAWGRIYYSTQPMTFSETTARGQMPTISGTVMTDSTYSAGKSITLTNLTQNVIYYYVIEAIDSANNVSLTWPATFIAR